MKPKYGMTITVYREDLPEVKLTVEMPEVDRDFTAANNPALKALFASFDSMVEDL